MEQIVVLLALNAVVERAELPCSDSPCPETVRRKKRTGSRNDPMRP